MKNGIMNNNIGNVNNNGTMNNNGNSNSIMHIDNNIAIGIIIHNNNYKKNRGSFKALHYKEAVQLQEKP